MAGGEERILRRRIKSIDATKKITRAMELIAASRIVKAQARVRAARPYSEKVTDVIANLASGGAGLEHPLLRQPTELRKIGYVILAADRGLAGAYNNNVLRAAEQSLNRDRARGHDYELILSGRKAVGYFRFRRYRITESFTGFSDQPSYEDARRMAHAAAAMFDRGEVDMVRLVYTRFLSIGRQEVAVSPFMPLDTSSLGTERPAGVSALYEFEPGPDVILDRLLPRYAEARLYSALLESSASEHAARQRAMKSATDNAEDLRVTLTRIMNRARQDAITTEIMEIVGGAEALKKGGKLVSTDLLEDRIEGRATDVFRRRVRV